MRILVFSDVHGNIYALQELVKRMELIEFDKIVFCGDVFGYYYNQRDVFDMLKSMDNLIWIKGNHDDFFVKVFRGVMPLEKCIEKYGHSYEIAMSQFNLEDVEFFDSLPSKYVIDNDGCRVGIFHGTPSDSLNGRLYPDNSVLSPDEYTDYDIVILGHTHCRMVRHVGETLVINSGSIGQPRDGAGFGYALIDTNTKKVEFYNVNFDRKELYNQIDEYDSNLTKLKEVIERGNK